MEKKYRLKIDYFFNVLLPKGTVGILDERFNYYKFENKDGLYTIITKDHIKNNPDIFELAKPIEIEGRVKTHFKNPLTYDEVLIKIPVTGEYLPGKPCKIIIEA